MKNDTIYMGWEDAHGESQVIVLDYQGSHRLDLRLDLRNHSPTGFAWGYYGSGPAQLALAILADLVGDDAALRSYQDFKSRVVAQWPQTEAWSITSKEIFQTLEVLEKGAA